MRTVVPKKRQDHDTLLSRHGSIRRRAVARGADGTAVASRAGTGGRARRSPTTPSGWHVMTARLRGAHRRRPPHRRPRQLPTQNTAPQRQRPRQQRPPQPPRPPRSRRNPNVPCASRPLPPRRPRRSRAEPAPSRKSCRSSSSTGARLPGREANFTAQDGSIWVQTDSQRLTGIPDPPFDAELKPGAMGSYFLVPKEQGRAIRVRAATLARRCYRFRCCSSRPASTRSR